MEKEGLGGGKAFMDKDEILANMYTLRAGLSVVAVNSEKVDRALKSAKAKAQKDEKAARDKLKKAYKDMDAHRAKIQRDEEGIEERKAAGKAAVRENADNVKSTAKNIALGVLAVVFGIATILFLVYAVLFWVMSFGAFGDPPENDFILTLYSWTFPYLIAGAEGTTWSGEPNAAFVWGSIGATIASLPLAGFGAFCIFKSGELFSDGKFKLSKKTKGMTGVKEYQQDIERRESDIAYISSLIPSYESDIAKAQEDGKALVYKTCQQVAPTCAAVGALYSLLRKTFSSFLDERDWNNLDLLTYYVETGRADSVKESLQLLDRQKQTDQIVTAVNEAAGAVCRAVQMGLSALQQDMHRCFGILSDQITTVGRMVNSVAGGIDALGSRVSAVESQNAQLSQMVSTANLNSALAARASDSSAQLVEYAKTCANNSNYVSGVIRQAQISGKI